MPRLIISITDLELEALVRLAISEMRTPRDQARYLIHKELLSTKIFKNGTKEKSELLPHMEGENRNSYQIGNKKEDTKETTS